MQQKSKYKREEQKDKGEMIKMLKTVGVVRERERERAIDQKKLL